MLYKNGVYDEAVIFRNGNRHRVKLSPEIIRAKKIADNLSRSICGKEIFITSQLDGKHSPGSKHYDGKAFDMRTVTKKYYTTEQINDITELLKIQLGNDYDVVLHDTHLHIEHDPKTNKK